MCHVDINPCWIKFAFWVVAVVGSALYGWFAVDALEVSEDDKARISENGPLRWHQRWLNFLGSFVGWSLAYVVLRRVFSTHDFHATDFPLAFLACVGMTGHVPYVVKHVWKWKFPWPSSGDPEGSSKKPGDS
jgi:hypothetical protein